MSSEEPNFWGRVVRGHGRIKARREIRKEDENKLKQEVKDIEEEAYQAALKTFAVEKGIQRAKEGNGFGSKFAKLKKFGSAASKTFAAPKDGKEKGDPLAFI